MVRNLIGNRIEKVSKAHIWLYTVVVVCMSVCLSFLVIENLYSNHIFFFGNDRYTFKSKIVEDVVQKKLGKTVVTKKDLSKIKKLTIKNEPELTDISDIGMMKNLKELNICKCNVKDISKISDCVHLKTLNLSENNIYSVDCLTKCVELEKLIVNGNHIQNVDILLTDTSIKTIHAKNNMISAVDITRENSQLTDVDLSGNRISNTDFLDKLPNIVTVSLVNNKLTALATIYSNSLQELDLTGNTISNTSAFKYSDLPMLQRLYIGNNMICDLSFLSGCPNLVELSVFGNNITSLVGVENCQGLESINIMYNNIYDVTPLKSLKHFNTIYVDDDFDRAKLEFLQGHLRNADKITKEYLIGNEYNLSGGE